MTNSHPESSRGIDMVELCGNLGVEPALVNEDNLTQYIVPAAVETFLDGEVRTLHSKPDDERLRELFGDYEFSKGTFMPALAALREQAHRARSFEGEAHTDDQLIGFEGFCARLVGRATAESEGGDPYNWLTAADLVKETGQRIPLGAVHSSRSPLDMSAVKPTTQLAGDKIILGPYVEQLDRRPNLVMHYGPSIQGRYHIDAQIQMLQSGTRPFSYMPIARGAFINRFLIEYLNAKTEQAFGQSGIGKLFIDRQLYLGREDGIGAATDEMINAQRAHKAPYDIFDLVIASGLYTVPRDELAKGFENAYKLLRSGGALALRHPISTLDSAGVGVEVLKMVKDAGFHPEEAVVRYEKTGPEGETDSLAVLLRKP